MKSFKVTITRIFDFEGKDEDEVMKKLTDELVEDAMYSGVSEWLKAADIKEVIE